ncbi:lipoprotein localization protein LolB [Halomonas eurihalina]|uniref:Outer-membrane lipoprotein LolB n=1 Tax=Halomonas eurihalina TaxID=42566 RepID=A0A5D9D973_HALER|nr:lipoprotein insertase outer membrane protein LolB [Halomonas eurihalina]MDR5859668.1 lipoprotein insertase outer membrane protein LolB [Halomonas eurihalina]TZG39125.1 lipoprotein localization protein LolB [Halomonas eurihalina]
MQRRHSIQLTCLAMALILLAGCASRAPTPDTQRTTGQWDAQQEHLAELQDWKLQGKAGLRTPQDSTSANLDWLQTPYYFRILLSGPFGSGRSVLEGREGRVSLTTGEGRAEAESPQALMQQELGWSLPVSALTDWIRGLPANDRPHQLEKDELGFPAHLEQDGWEIDYRDWSRVGELWLPRRMKLTYDDLVVTLVVTRWQPEPDEDA